MRQKWQIVIRSVTEKAKVFGHTVGPFKTFRGVQNVGASIMRTECMKCGAYLYVREVKDHPANFDLTDGNLLDFPCDEYLKRKFSRQ